MAGGKSSSIKGTAFQGTAKLSKDDCRQLAVADAKSTDHLTPNWLNSTRSILCLHLRPDNVTIDSASILLAGLLHQGEKAYQCKNYWLTEPVLSLIFAPLDLSLFTFPANCLSSNLLDAANLPHRFVEGNTTVPQETLSTLGIQGFCLRANLYPSHPDWMKLTITIYPRPATALCEEFQLAVSPAFPGMLLDAGGAIHLGPSAAEIFPDIQFGSPVAPALVSSTPWDRAIGYPPTAKIIHAIASFLRTAVRPVHVKSLDNLAKAWDDISERGEAALKFKAPDLLWPEPPEEPATSQGTTSSTPGVFSFFPGSFFPPFNPPPHLPFFFLFSPQFPPCLVS